MGGKEGEVGGEVVVEDPELPVLLERLIRPPNEPSNILTQKHEGGRGGGEGEGGSIHS